MDLDPFHSDGEYTFAITEAYERHSGVQTFCQFPWCEANTPRWECATESDAEFWRAHEREHESELCRHPLAILNFASVTADGTFCAIDVSEHVARLLVDTALNGNSGIVSYVGHADTARILTGILGTPVGERHEMLTQQAGQYALAFKLNRRPLPGVELSRADLLRIGFTFKVIHRVA